MTTTEYFTTNNAAVAGCGRIYEEKNRKFDPETDSMMSIEMMAPCQYRPHILCGNKYSVPKIEKVGDFFIITFGKDFYCKDFQEFCQEGVVIFQYESGVEIVTKDPKVKQKIENFVQRSNNFRVSFSGRLLTVRIV